MQRKLLGILNLDFSASGPLLLIYFVFVKYLKKNGNMGVHQLFVDFKKVYDFHSVFVFMKI